MLSVLALLVASFRRGLSLPATARRAVWQVTARQIVFTGVEAIPLVVLLGGSVGVLVILNSADRLPDFGQAEFMGKLLVLIILRELGPILVTFLVAARSGTAIAAELATMGTRGEIEGLSGAGVDPLAYLVLPRVVGVATAIIALTVVFNLVAFVSGFTVAAMSRPTLSIVALFETLFRAMTMTDLLLSMMKAGFMGIAIAGICARQGLSARRASTEVPIVTLSAVVQAFWVCVVIELVLTGVFTDLGSLTS
jgi:phospholipid/cholesterol/gamma-HCH transport system permease protein